MQEALYLKAAKAAYANSLDLFKDATILYSHKRYPRAFALAVLSCEEFAKAFLYKCMACGFVLDKEFHRDLAQHELKLAHLAHMFSMVDALSSINADFQKALKHDNDHKDHSKHVLPKVFDKLLDSNVMPLIDVLKLSHHYKILALYVDVKDGKIHEPKFMKKEPCHKFLHIIERHIFGFDKILNETPDQFRKTVQILDPDIIKNGKIKFDFMPKGRFISSK